MTKKILFVVAHTEYQPIEYSVPKKLIEQAGFTVVTASNKPGNATATDGSTTTVDLLVPDADVHDYDGIFLVGGSGALSNLDNIDTHELVAAAAQARKLLGAICIATRILANAEVLKDHLATGWNGDNELARIYQEHGVHYTAHDVVVDTLIVTATGPNAAREYGEQIIALLQENDR